MAANALNGFLYRNGKWRNSHLRDPVSILILNLMPNKEETEKQFLENFDQLNKDVEITFLFPITHTFKSIPFPTIAQSYASYDQIVGRSYDGLIVTGAPVEKLPFKEVDYWQEFQMISSWATRHTKQSLFECWAALGGLYNDYEIPKKQLSKKIFGIYSSSKINKGSDLTKELTEQDFLIPQSRHSTADITSSSLPNGLEIIANNHEIGPLAYYSSTFNRTYITGHPEYEIDTLAKEYFRDLNRNLPIEKPCNYFVNKDTDQINYSWKETSHKFYQNWLNTLAAKKEGTLL